MSLGRGLDLVVLDAGAALVEPPLKVSLDGLPAVLERLRPGVIAIDGPPGWGASGASRPVERLLVAMGIAIFPTPEQARARPLHGWMRASFAVFAAAAGAGCAAIEVFPHASAVTLLGELPGRSVPKVEFRRRALRAAGVDEAALVTLDQVDAALCAVTGLRHLEGRASSIGEPGGPQIVLPVARPGRRYVRALTGMPPLS